MHCPRCGEDNPERAKFCLDCGTRLALICPQCGTELPPGARFCFECGTPIDASEKHDLASRTKALERLVPREFAERLLSARGKVSGERRMVTILFSDVKGSTAMAENLDPEEVMEIMNGAFDLLIEPIYRYEGTLARLMGDAILAFFGAPVAHEDDPERACRAALDIIDGAKRYATRLEEERGISGFNVRVGINTGLVVVGEVGSDLRVEYTAMGDAINLASRMESAAEPGTILITEDTHKLITPLFETEDLGCIEIKGKADPVSVYRVLSPKETPGKARGIAGLESPLVGREVELDGLREALDRLRMGIGGIVTIVGEAGLGKSRLVAELRNEARTEEDKPPLWIEGHCLSYGTSIAYLLWLDVLRGLLGVTAEDAPAGVANVLGERVRELCPEEHDQTYPYLARLMSLPLPDEEEALRRAQDAAKVRELEGAKVKSGTFDAVKRLIRCAATERPLVIVCEDLHWADPTSIELLEQLLAVTERAPLLLIPVFRPDKDHGCWRIREITARLYGYCHTALWLQPLSPDESKALVGNLLRVESLPTSLKARILSHAEGNPFYVEEVIRSLIDTEAIVRDDRTGNWVATRELEEIAIPDTLHGVLVARIDRLHENTRRVLQMASVVGRVFLYRVLAAIAQEERRLDEQLRTLQRDEMIRRRAQLPELEYIFKHQLTRDAAYNGLLKKQRGVFHRQAAEALERLFPDRIEEQLGLLAYHWERSGDTEKAKDYLLRAGDQARMIYSHEEAIGYYQRALALLKGQGEHERSARTLMKLGLTYHTAFDFRRSHEAYDEAFALWQLAAQTRPAAPPAAPHALRVIWWADPETLDPSMAPSIMSACLIEQLFSGLVALTSEMGVVPDLARSWEMSEGGRRYVFHLRDDVRWTDGAPLTADDFEYAWRRALDPARASPVAGLLYDVKGAARFHQGQDSDPGHVGVRALDQHTLVVELEEPTGYFLQLLANCAAYPIPRHVVEAHGEAWTEMENIVSNGPFRLETWERGKSMALARSPSYHGGFTGNVQRVELTLSPLWEWSAQVEMYKAHGLDTLAITYFPPEEFERVRQRHAEEYVSAPALCIHYLTFAVNRAPFDDVRVRRAFAMALDREASAQAVTGGALFPATGGLIPPGMPGHSPRISLPCDPERARELLAEAGYPDGRSFPVVQLLGLRAFEPTMQDLQTRWRENLGVEIRCEGVRLAAYEDSFKQQYAHMYIHAWEADYPDPDNFLRVGLQRYVTGWQNDSFHSLVEDARQLIDQAHRMELYAQADRILAADAVALPLVYERQHFLIKPWVRNYSISGALGGFWKDVVIEPH